MSEEWVRATVPNWLSIRLFEDGTYAAVHPLLYHWTLIYGIVGDETGYEDRWCYMQPDDAVAALLHWDYPVQREPEGWHRNPRTGRRRPGGDKEKEHVAW